MVHAGKWIAKHKKLILLAAVIYITLVKFRKHPILYIAAAAAAGIIFQL